MRKLTFKHFFSGSRSSNYNELDDVDEEEDTSS